METKTIVATGDSFTEGMQDDLNAQGRHRGWADRVAAALAVRNGRIRYANLAVRGRLLDQVIDEQVPAAVERLGITDPLLLGPELLGGSEGWWREALPPRATPTWASRGRDVRDDVQWARKYFVPWVGRRIRKVSSGDLMVAKQAELVEIVAPSGRKSR